MNTKRGIFGRSNYDVNSQYLLPGKKAQVTIFIIIGIVILFAFAGILYFTKNVVKEGLTAEGEPIITSVPQEFQPVQTFTENCLNQLGKKGLLILGQQGGYISPNLVGKYSSSNPTETDGINLEPINVPYWHYNKNPNADNKIIFSSLKPKLYAKEDSAMSIESQLSRFVKEKLDGCLKNYSAFEDQGFNFVLPKSKEVEVKVADGTVNFWLKMPVTAKKGEAEASLDQFYVKVPLNLKLYYQVADEITQVEQNYSFLELQALDLIATYSATDINKLPPTEAVTFDLISSVSWSEADIKEKMKRLLISNVPMLRYLGSDNFYRYEYKPSATAAVVTDLSELYQKNYDNTILPLELGTGLETSFDYFGWEPYFDLADKNGIIKPSDYAAQFWILNFHTQQYRSSYDISYPVLITLRDPKALNGESYSFVFALESNLRNSQAVKDGETVPAPIIPTAKSMVCDESKKTTELVKTIVVDSFTKEPLEAVQIGFSIPNQDDCMMGLTDTNGEFESKYPPVYGGVGSYFKEGYLNSFYPIDTYSYKKNPGIIGYALSGYPQKAISLNKIKAVNITVKKKNLEKCIGNKCFTQSLFGSPEDSVYSYQPEMLDSKHSWVFINQPKALGEKETATLILRRVGDLEPLVKSDDFVATVNIKGNSQGNALAEINLVPGMYEVTALITDEQELLIPKEERCTGGVMESLACWDSDGCCFTFDENKFDKMLIGQLAWDIPKTYMKITPEQLYGSSQITFNVLSFNLAGVPQEAHKRVMEDLQVMGMLGNLSQQLRASLEPNYS